MDQISYKTAKGWLRKEEREFLYTLAQSLPVRPIIVNIGIEFGASIVCFVDGHKDARVIGIDIETRPFLSEYPDGLGIELLRGDSYSYGKKWDHVIGKKIDLLFVDGDHTHAGVTRDLIYTRHVKSGGYVVFHDCYDFDDPTIVHRVCPGVNRAVDDWLFDGRGNEWTELERVGTMRVFRRV